MPFLTDLFADHAFWAWAGLAAALLAVEVGTGSGWLLWPAASAGLVAAIDLATPLPTGWAIALFAALTIASTLLTHRLMAGRTSPTGEDINDNIGRLVGHHGKAVAAFAGQAGRVFIDGKEWAAELEDGEALPAGASVQVTGVRGAHLVVRAA